MKCWIVQTLTLTVSFLIVPQLIHAEGTGEAESKTLNSLGTLINEQTLILENNLNETAEVVEVLAESTTEITGGVEGTVDTTVRDVSEIVKQTENNLSDAESKTIPAAVNQTSKTVENTANNVKSLVKKTTETTKETVKATSEVTKNIPKSTNNLKDKLEKTADAVIEELPQIPVVTPIVKDVKNNGTKMAASVEKTVEQINQTKIPATKVFDENPVYFANMPVLETDEIVQTEDAVTENEAQEVSNDQETLAGMEIKQPIPLMESVPLTERVQQEISQVKDVKPEQPWYSKPLSQNQQEPPSPYQPMEITLTPPNSMSSSYSSASSTSNPGVSDGLMGVLVLPFNQSMLSRESWKPGNEFALKQWIYDPLGQPPKFTPFLHLI